MTRGAKTAAGLVSIFLVGSITVGLFLHNLVTRSWPQTSGKVNISGLHNPVEIFRDEYGVPHIAANDEHDLMYAAGYIHAQDRLWQMELARRAGEGRLSEILDTAGIEFDILFRTLGFRNLAESLYTHLDPVSVRILQDYTEGVNELIRTHKGRYPIEFDMINRDPEPWTPQHSLLVGRLLAWELSFSWWIELVYGRIESLVSEEKFNELISTLSDIPPRERAQEASLGSQKSLGYFCEMVRKYRQYFKKSGYSAGSNAWVIGSSKSLGGKPILANDPHLIVTLPSHWYEMHLSAPGWEIYGVTVPGIPLIVIGHNKSYAWGLTNAMLDDADFYVEAKDSVRPDDYIYNNRSFPVKSRTEVIYVGASDSVILNVRETQHGIIVNDVHPVLRHVDSGDSVEQPPVSLRWTGFDMSDEFLGFYKMNKGTNSKEFAEGLQELTVPGQCVVYADVEGNIGWWLAGRIPIRGKNNGILPLRGWLKENDWKGYVPFSDLPRGWNPEEGYIAFANQEIGKGTFPYYISTLWEPSYRYNRIRSLLSGEKLSAKDFQVFQQDIVSDYDRFLAEEILRVFSADETGDQAVQGALVYLRSWDTRCSPSDIASSIINTFFVRLVENIFIDELEEDIYADFVYYPVTCYQATERLLKKEQALWFDDVRTGRVESKGDIIKRSFIEALKELEKRFGPETKTWQWGKIHQILCKHPFAVQSPLDIIFNVGPFQTGGSGQTINKGAYQLTNPYSVFAAPSMRQIVDLAEPANALMINSLGQSGQPLHRHYSDQISLWLNGIYRETTMELGEIRGQGWDLLTLLPE